MDDFNQLYAAFQTMKQANDRNAHTAQACNQELEKAVATMRTVAAARKGSER